MERKEEYFFGTVKQSMPAAREKIIAFYTNGKIV
jgi:hypothetical protein